MRTKPRINTPFPAETYQVPQIDLTAQDRANLEAMAQRYKVKCLAHFLEAALAELDLRTDPGAAKCSCESTNDCFKYAKLRIAPA